MTEHAEAFQAVAAGTGAGPTHERMLELAVRHEEAEFDNDLEGVMATLVEEPRYELYPQALRITGREAVRAFYTSVMPVFAQLDPRAKAVQTREVVSICFGDTMMSAELADDYTFPDGVTRRIQSAAVVHFEGDLLLGERLYLDEAMAALIDEALGEDFRALPGVRRI